MNNMDLDGDGKVSKWEYFPYWFDRLRVFPRLFISIYIYMFYQVTMWFMGLEDPNMAQAGLVSVVTGAGAAWFGLYVNSKSNAVVKVPEQSGSMPTSTTRRKQEPVVMPQSNEAEG
jgi:hypothetical protein|tara:strand:+ start:120 stop:467 length:348 start_codon:yes stop_codon:yes gene_type:complete